MELKLTGKSKAPSISPQNKSDQIFLPDMIGKRAWPAPNIGLGSAQAEQTMGIKANGRHGFAYGWHPKQPDARLWRRSDAHDSVANPEGLDGRHQSRGNEQNKHEKDTAG